MSNKVIFLVIILCHFTLCQTKFPLVLLISFDGFKWDYIEKANEAGYETPNFNSLISSGVVIDKPGLTNSFITKTFPNHYTLVTGMYEENHGVVANGMFDPSVNETFSIRGNGTSESFWFNNGSKSGTPYKGPMPIWNVNQMFDESEGIDKRHSGVMFWPGSEAEVDGKRPWHYRKYDASLPNKTRIDALIQWFINKQEPINLGLLYFSEPDHLGHIVGPNSLAMMAMISELDALVGFLVNRLQEEKLMEDLNIIITSDHGMAQTDNLIELDKYVDPTLYQHFGNSPIWNILPKSGHEDEIYNQMKNISNLHVFWKKDIPHENHYTYNRRIMPIVIEAAEGYILCNDDTCPTGGGNHGYNNSLASMHPFFIAHGPAFKKNFTAKPFNNVDVFPLICHLLQVEIPSNIDGNFENVKHILQDSLQGKQNTWVLVLVIGITCLTSVLLILLVYCVVTRSRRKHTRSIFVGKLDQTDSPNEGQVPLLLSSGEEDTVPIKL